MAGPRGEGICCCPCWRLAGPGALAILEERGDVVVNVEPVFKPLESRIFGDSKMHFYRYEP